MTLPQFVSRREVAAIFSTSTATVRRWEESQILPPPQIIGGGTTADGRKVPRLERWEISDVMACLARSLDRRTQTPAGSVDPDRIVQEVQRERTRARRQAQAR
jgi:hypothetical protein